VKKLLPSAIRRLARRLHDASYCRPLAGKKCLGTRDHWHVVTDLLSHESIVYSAGVGKDITFEHALVDEVGCRVHLFDPSPTGIATMASPQNQHPLIDFEPIGLADRDGLLSFSPPAQPEEGSYTVGDVDDSGTFMFRCETLRTIMGRLGHERIDLLKLDIEGSEYGVLEQLLEENLEVHQLCVEVHPTMITAGRSRTASLLASLSAFGYRVIHREMNDLTFLMRR